MPLAQPGGAVVVEAIALGRHVAQVGAVVQQGVPLAGLLAPRQEAARVAQVQHRRRQPQACAGDGGLRPEVREHLGRVVGLPQPAHPQRQRLAVGRPVQRRPLRARRVGHGQGGADPRSVLGRQRRFEGLARLLQRPAALLQAPAQRQPGALLADDGPQVDARPDRLQPPRPRPEVAPLHQGGQRQEVVDVQPRQARLQGADAGVGLEDGGVDVGRAGVGRPAGQAEAAQADDRRGRPAGVPRRVEPLEERRPERRPQPRDVVRPGGAQAAGGLVRQRVGGAHHVGQAVPHQARPSRQHGGVQRRTDGGFIEAQESRLEFVGGGAVEEGFRQQAVARRQDGSEARPERRQPAEVVGRRQAGPGVGAEQRQQGQRGTAGAPHHSADHWVRRR